MLFLPDGGKTAKRDLEFYHCATRSRFVRITLIYATITQSANLPETLTFKRAQMVET